MTKKTVILFLTFFLLLACEQKAQKDDTYQAEKIRNTIILYNSLLAEGYRNLDMGPLIQVATEDRIIKAYYHMSALGEGRVRMDAKLSDIKILDMDLRDISKAYVGTEEKWEYNYINIDTDEIVYDNTVTYRNKYSLINSAGKWLVSDITVEQSEEEKDIPFSPFQKSPRSGVSQKKTDKKNIK